MHVVKKHKEMILIVVPVAVTLLIGIFHLYLVKTQALTPWRAGGYGMFSTANDINLRSVVALKQNGESVPQFSERYRSALRRFKVKPNLEMLNRIAQSAACQPEAEGAVRLSFWEGHFEPETQGVRFQKRYQAEAVCPSR